jgi:hypothetical protein
VVVAAVGLAVEHGQIQRMYAVANPGKLEGIATEAALTRAPRARGSGQRAAGKGLPGGEMSAYVD